MDGLSTTAGALSTYGLYAICAALLIAVVYLFKQQRELEKEFRTNLATSASENAKLLERTAEVLRDNTEAIKGFQRSLDSFKDDVRSKT